MESSLSTELSLATAACLTRQPRTLPETRSSRQVEPRIRRMVEAWAWHANAANGFGAGEVAFDE